VQIPHVTGLKKLVNFPKICSCTISKNVINNSTTFENFIPSASPEKTCGLSRPSKLDLVQIDCQACHLKHSKLTMADEAKHATKHNIQNVV